MGSNPTLSATLLKPLVLAILLRPSAAWRSLRERPPAWQRTLLRQALPLSLLPSIVWPLVRATEGGHGPLAASLPAVLAGMAATLLFSMLSVVLLAAGFYMAAPMFGARRAWDASVALAAYASTPVFLASPFLAIPSLAALVVVGFLHCFALCYVGVEELLDCKDEEAPVFVACAWVGAGIVSAALGALCGAAGIL